MTERRLGVMAVLRNPKNNGVVLLPYHDEPGVEKRIESSGECRWMLDPKQLEMISGKVEPGEKPLMAMMREAAEERRLNINGKVKLINKTIEVYQERDGVPVSFLVYLFLTRLSENDMADLSSSYETVLVEDKALDQFLNEVEPTLLRPSVYNALYQLCSGE